MTRWIRQLGRSDGHGPERPGHSFDEARSPLSTSPPTSYGGGHGSATWPAVVIEAPRAGSLVGRADLRR